MAHKRFHSGVTLTEVLVVVAVITVLLAISVPAAKTILDSFDNSMNARSMINAALSSARAMAIRDGRYVGVRFQQALNGSQYMVYIVHDPPPPPDDAILAYGFRAVEGRKPIRLPENVGVMDAIRVERSYKVGPLGQTSVSYKELEFETPSNDADVFLGMSAAYMQDGRNVWYADATTFSVVFSPTGHVITHEVWVSNQHMVTDRSAEARAHTDKIFNWKDDVDAGNALLYEDDYGQWPVSRYPQGRGIGPEMSRKSFILFDKRKYEAVDPASRWSEYLEFLPRETVSPYTGDLIKRFDESR